MQQRQLQDRRRVKYSREILQSVHYTELATAGINGEK